MLFSMFMANLIEHKTIQLNFLMLISMQEGNYLCKKEELFDLFRRENGLFAEKTT